jgi:hypothetical protein
VASSQQAMIPATPIKVARTAAEFDERTQQG